GIRQQGALPRPLGRTARPVGAGPRRDAGLTRRRPRETTQDLLARIGFAGRPAGPCRARRPALRDAPVVGAHVVYHEEDFEIRDATGRIVAQSRQLALLPPSTGAASLR